MIVFPQYPNETPVAKFSASSTSYRVIATDGVDYASLAALAAAGKTPFPGVDSGIQLGALAVVSTDGSNAAGSPIRVKLNSATAPTSGTGQWIPGGTIGIFNPGIVTSVWVQKTVGGDVAELIYRY